jgi:hypothetical protein
MILHFLFYCIYWQANCNTIYTKYGEVSLHAMQEGFYERVPETPCLEPPREKRQFFGGSLGVYTTLCSGIFSIAVSLSKDVTKI